jgi:chromosome segregation ATPase
MVSVLRLTARFLLVACLVALPDQAVRAQAGSGGAAPTEMDAFVKEYGAFKDSLTALPKKIEETSSQVDSAANPAAAHQQIDALRAIVSEMLALVADNGKVASLGRTAVNHAHRKLAELQQDTRFSKAQRDQLVAEWQRVSRETDAAVADLEVARKELSELLRLLQSNEDFLAELEELNQASKTVEAIRTLTLSLRDISARLKDLIQNRMKVPSM